MEKQLITTDDGSHTLFIPEWKETYHSKFGSIQESKHVFIHHGLHHLQGDTRILEIGFGTGLNAILTFLESIRLCRNIYYETVEAFPISVEDAMKLNYMDALGANSQSDIFIKMHSIPAGYEDVFHEFFTFKKRYHRFEEINDTDAFDLIYYDAFGARVQPELWKENLFLKMYNALKVNGILVTYASKSSARKAMISAGFEVEKCPGPIGRRDMLRAYKRL